ncbi:hypothetical protein BC939DRAFT_333332 [Gamsiella multidivaricata]|uniref:uncharacterized protein n=1 Tax=Gamsiella multidivaricata TaxID=101098 RepID=UPI002220E25C|nr:uncharacterized protein BC939DRAFT_333332 [Gamsiella multidivaricata]KAI7817320.1 hypothetical protein BC939DRAFT_333332 [Gamsiella multidivaricata]
MCCMLRGLEHKSKNTQDRKLLATTHSYSLALPPGYLAEERTKDELQVVAHVSVGTSTQSLHHQFGFVWSVQAEHIVRLPLRSACQRELIFLLTTPELKEASRFVNNGSVHPSPTPHGPTAKRHDHQLGYASCGPTGGHPVAATSPVGVPEKVSFPLNTLELKEARSLLTKCFPCG